MPVTSYVGVRAVGIDKVCVCVHAGSAVADARYLASSQEPDEELQSLLSYEEVCQNAIPDLKVTPPHPLPPPPPNRAPQTFPPFPNLTKPSPLLFQVSCTVPHCS